MAEDSPMGEMEMAEDSAMGQTEMADTAPDAAPTTAAAHEERRGHIAPRSIALGDVTIESACVDLPGERSAICRAACMAFLIAVDAGQLHWYPKHLDRLVFQGIEIQKRQPEATSNGRHHVQIRTHLTLHTIRSAEPLVFSAPRAENAKKLLDANNCCLVEWRQCSAAIFKRKVGDTFNIFQIAGQRAPKLLQIEGVKGLHLTLSSMSNGNAVSITPLAITRRFGARHFDPSGYKQDEYQIQPDALPDYHKLSEKARELYVKLHKRAIQPDGVYDQSSFASKKRRLGGADPTGSTSGSSSDADGTQTTGPTPTLPPREWPPQDAKIRSAWSLVQSRPPVTLTEEVAILEGYTLDWGHPETVAMSQQVWDFVCELVKAVGKRDPLFAGVRVTLVGSHGDGTDVRSKAIEFDSLISVTCVGIKLEKGDGMKWSVWVREDALEDGGMRSVLRGQPRIVNGVNECEIDPMAFLLRWMDGLTTAGSTVTLPEGLTHGGPLSPMYAGVKVGSTTATLSLVWQGETRMTSDLTPAIPVPREALEDVTQKAVCCLEGVAGLERSSHPVHLVPGRVWKDDEGVADWIPTTCVVETHALAALGPRSAPVSLIRGLKLLARRYLQWCPLNEMESEVRQAKDTLVDLSGGNVGSRGIIGGLVGVEGLAECVRASIQIGKLILPERMEGERRGMAGRGAYWSRVALVITATHKAHWAGRTTGVDHVDCRVCNDLAHVAQELLNNAPLLHPAVGEAVGVPPSPQLEVPSAFLKYLILSDLVRGEAGGRERVAQEEVEWYMKDLADRLAKWGGVPHPILQGEGVRHPLLSGERVEDIPPRSERGVGLDTSHKGRCDLTRSHEPLWRLLPRPLRQCHAEICRQLYDAGHVYTDTPASSPVTTQHDSGSFPYNA